MEPIISLWPTLGHLLLDNPDYCYKAVVERVVDGDTIDVLISLGFNVKIKERLRLSGIDSPETYGVKKESDEYAAGMIAKNRLIELVENKDIIVKTEKKGKYGRYIAEIFINEQSVNQILLSEGLVKPY